MRATPTITRLLLSLSFLFQSVCSDVDTQTGTPVTKDTSTAVVPAPSGGPSGVSTGVPAGVPAGVPTGGTTARIDMGVTGKTAGGAGGTTAAPTAVNVNVKNDPTQVSTQPNVVAANPTGGTTAVAKTSAAQPLANTVTHQATAPTGRPGDSSPVMNVATSASPAAAAATTAPKVVTTVLTKDSSNSPVLTTRPITVQTPQAPIPSKTAPASASQPGDPGHVGPTVTTLVPTHAPSTKQPSGTNAPIVSTASQGDGKGGTHAVPKTTPGPTAARATDPAGNAGTTLAPSTPTQAGPPALVTRRTNTGTTAQPATTIPPTTARTTPAPPKKFVYSLLSGQETKEEQDLAEVCRRLMPNWQEGTCTLTWRHHNGKVVFDCVEINGKVKTNLATQFYEEITKKPTDNKTLIAILASCGALLIMIVILAVCASHHRKPYNENQQHLTEELHTVENGYHDNPTLEVMEVQPEMQEKKVALNGEFNDSWIVPIDNLLKEDVPDEEDTHL